MTELEPAICLVCGDWVKRPQRIEVVTAWGEEQRLGPGVVRLNDAYQHDFQLTRCDECQTRRWRAEALAEEHPAVVRRIGSPSVAIDHIDGALTALATNGVDVDRMNQLTATDRDLRRLLRLLAAAGIEARWVSRLLPYIPVGVSQRPSVPRWSHISEEHAGTLKDAFARLLFERLGGTRKVAPPSDGVRGCLLCGVGEIETKASDPEEAWGQRRPAHPGTLGGRGRVEPIWGYLCPVCADITDAIGVLGPTAVERALIAFLGVTPQSIDPIQLDGARAWVALRDGTPPNATPWAHEPDHEGIKRLVQSA